MNTFDAIMKIEGGEFQNIEDYVECFQVLIDSGTVWSLQGWYGREARSLIERGLCYVPVHKGSLSA